MQHHVTSALRHWVLKVHEVEVQKGEKVEENMKYAYKGSESYYVSMLSLNSNNITHGF